MKVQYHSFKPTIATKIIKNKDKFRYENTYCEEKRMQNNKNIFEQIMYLMY